MKAFALIRMDGGAPDLPAALGDETFNYVLCDRLGSTDWGAYLCSARPAVLRALDEDYAGFIGIVAVSDDGEVYWGELENPCSTTLRNRLSTWLENHGYPTIPDGWTNRRVVYEIFRRANNRFDFTKIDILEVM